MNEQPLDIVVLIIFIAMAVAMVTGSISLFYLRILFRSDERISESDKSLFPMFNGEIGYIEDLPEEHKNRYIKGLKTAKYSFLIFAMGFLAMIADVIISGF